ncbi:MAG: CZB domain-containing protein, partial [Acetatifactor sp.]|nr:CZB domain-containing protein [Acetatifactor sp.]
ERKCGFGHFYYAMNPINSEAMSIWKALGEKHGRFHAYGKQVIDALFAEDYKQAEKLYEEASQYSQVLIRDLEALKKACD